MLFRICAVLCNFYPRPPRGGRPVCFAAGRVSVSISIHALREEGDSSPIFKKVAILNFYPRPPRGGRRGVCAGIVAPELISIHALREEGDHSCRSSYLAVWYFYPRPPRGGRQDWSDRMLDLILFLSTPSARRATRHTARAAARSRNFYPRPPRGGRPRCRRSACCRRQISIHALREEGDSKNRDKISIFKQIIQHSARI